MWEYAETESGFGAAFNRCFETLTELIDAQDNITMPDNSPKNEDY